MLFKYYFSCKRENIPDFSDLSLNHIGISNLSKLIAHNFMFFNRSFEHIILLNLCLKMKKGFNYRSLPCSTKNRYFLDLKHIIVDFSFNRADHSFKHDKKAIHFSENFHGNNFVFFESEKEDCYFQEPIEDKDYIESKSCILPDIDNYRNIKIANDKGRGRNKRVLIEILSSTTNECSDSDDDLKESLFKYHHPLGPDIEDLNELEKEELERSKKYILENKDSLEEKLEDYIIKKFEYQDINNFNRAMVISNSLIEFFGQANEHHKKEIESLKFYHGVRGFDIITNDGEIAKEYNRCFEFLCNRLKYMGGVFENMVPKGIWEKHMILLENLKKSNTLLSEYRRKKKKIERTVYKREIKRLTAKSCQIMLDIKSLYPKYTYIQDEYLDRNTEFQKDVNFCDFMHKAINYLRKRKAHNTPGLRDEKKSRFSENLFPSVVEKMKLGRDEFTPSEAKIAAKNILNELKEEYEVSKELVLRKMGFEWTCNMIHYFSNPSEIGIEDLNERLAELNQSYNCMIMTSGSWDENDDDHFHHLLQEIFREDDNFENYLSPGLRKVCINSMLELGKILPSIISTVNRNPKYKDELEMMKVTVENKKIENENHPLLVFGRIIDAMKNSDKGKTVKGGVKIEEYKGEEKEREKNLRKMERSNQLYQLDLNSARELTNSMVEKFVEIYRHLGDTINLSPFKLKLKQAYCECRSESQMGHYNHYRNALLTQFNKVQVGHSGVVRHRELLQKKEKRVEDLEQRRKTYLNVVENMAKIEKERNIYLEEKRIKREEEESRERELRDLEIKREKDRINQQNNKKEEGKDISMCRRECLKTNEQIIEDYKRINELKRNRKKDSIVKSFVEQSESNNEEILEEIEIRNRFSVLAGIGEWTDNQGENSCEIGIEETNKVWADNSNNKLEVTDFTKKIKIFNRFEFLYTNKKDVQEAEEMAGMFLKNSENLKIVQDVELLKLKASKINELKRERISKYGFCDKNTTRSINESCGSVYVKKYKMRGIKDVLILIALCQRNGERVDSSYIKSKFGLKRCQINYLILGLKLAIKRLNSLRYQLDVKYNKDSN